MAKLNNLLSSIKMEKYQYKKFTKPDYEPAPVVYIAIYTYFNSKSKSKQLNLTSSYIQFIQLHQHISTSLRHF